MATVEELQKQIDEMKFELEKVKAVDEIQRLMAKYEYYHNSFLVDRTPELFALNMPDVRMDVSDWGYFEGEEGVRLYFTPGKFGPANETLEEKKGCWFFHSLATPAIQVSGDGQTAKGTWWSPGYECTPTMTKGVEGKFEVVWCFGQYGVDFIKVDGVWKIWHMKWYRHFRSNFYKSPIEAADEMIFADYSLLPPEMKPVSYFKPLTPDNPQWPIPAYPEPFQTHEGGFDWTLGEWKDEMLAEIEAKRAEVRKQLGRE